MSAKRQCRYSALPISVDSSSSGGGSFKMSSLLHEGQIDSVCLFHEIAPVLLLGV